METTCTNDSITCENLMDTTCFHRTRRPLAPLFSLAPRPPPPPVTAGSQQYDHDKMVPMYGFGARVGGVVKHAFALNFNEEDPEVQGVNGMLAAYRCEVLIVNCKGEGE